MTTTIRALLVGTVAGGAVAFVLADALAVSAAATGLGARLSIGSLLIVSVDHAEQATTTAFGVGLAVVAVVVGIANAVAAVVIERRRRR